MKLLLPRHSNRVTITQRHRDRDNELQLPRDIDRHRDNELQLPRDNELQLHRDINRK